MDTKKTCVSKNLEETVASNPRKEEIPEVKEKDYKGLQKARVALSI